MKQSKFIITLSVILVYSFSLNAQVGSFVLGNNQVGVTFLPGEKESPDIEKIKHKTYLTSNYEPATINDLKETVFLRYNMFKDEMEFTKNGNVYYMNKNKDIVITFKNLNSTYKTLFYKDKLQYFQIHNQGDNQLLSKQIVSYLEPKPAATSYQKAKPADFKRESDKYYVKFQDNSIVELPTRKKNFYEVFGNNSQEIKKFVKANKISIKDINDLKQVINYYNTL